MPLRIPQLCMVGSKLWKDPASSYIMFEFLRQLGQKACSLFGKIFEGLIAFLDSPRNKKQFSKQLSFVAFNLGLISQGVEALGRGQDEWSKLVCHLSKPQAYVYTCTCNSMTTWLFLVSFALLDPEVGEKDTALTQ